MSSGNITTEETRRELAADEAVIREAALVRNAVLRRALAIAAYEHSVRLGLNPEQASLLMLTWVMTASDELQGTERQGTRQQGNEGTRDGRKDGH